MASAVGSSMAHASASASSADVVAVGSRPVVQGVKYVCGGMLSQPTEKKSSSSKNECCNLECGYENLLKAKEPVQCKNCGYRILYKMRTQRSKDFFCSPDFLFDALYLVFVVVVVQFLAR
jgi:DNA-directed RNA polymerase I, II, and III subunit RPABC4